MKSTWRHRWNRLLRRRGGLPRSARLPLPGRSYNPFARRRAFARPRFGRYDTAFNWQSWLRRAALALFAAGAVWVLWQSWLGLGVFNN